MSRLEQKSENESRSTYPPLKKVSPETLAARPISQVPYLNGVFDDEETINEPHVVYVRETDSEYARRCKLGGSRDLLVYVDPAKYKSKEPVAYARPLWWDAMCEDYPSPLDIDDDQLKERSSSKNNQECRTPDRVVQTTGSNSPDKRKSAASKQSHLSQNSKRK